MTKQLITTYKSLLNADIATKQKLDALLETNALYKLFEHDSSHLYFSIADIAKNNVIRFKEVFAGVRDWSSENDTIAFELDKIKARQIVNGEEVDDAVDQLRMIAPTTMSETQVADELYNLVSSSFYLWAQASEKDIKVRLVDTYGKKIYTRHRESPTVTIFKECRTAKNDTKKLIKELMLLGNGVSTIRAELEKKKLAVNASMKSNFVLLDQLLKI
ncbi:hypothetical protein B472_04950 [Limnohabitans sp. Rim28]|nr:hypothetical protein B472_04950 [Limnohabitans sp. Rim28]